MGSRFPSPKERIRRRLSLSHVEERSNEWLRERWQRRPDSEEQWDRRADTAAPECPACVGRRDTDRSRPHGSAAVRGGRDSVQPAR